MSYSEWESNLDFKFAINSASDFDSGSDSNTDSDSSSVLMNLLIFVFLFCTYTLPKKLADNFYFSFS